MMGNCKEDGQWSVKKMEGGEGFKTLECLRGRLLAERQASRSAKEEAELLGKKLMELENQIRKETELKNKAEKRLNFLIKKLGSLNITSMSVASENSTLSEISTNSSHTKRTEEQELTSENVISTIPENLGEKVPETSTSKQRNENLRVEDKNRQNRADSSPNSSPKYESLKSSCTDPIQNSKISQSKDHSFSVEVNEREHEDYKDNSPAPIPATSPAANSETGEMKSKPVHVLDAVKRIKENAQSSFERRHNMKAIMSM